MGSSKHFLEEEKFRKRASAPMGNQLDLARFLTAGFIRQYPDLRDKLILSIEQWEGTHQKPFKHQGIALGEPGHVLLRSVSYSTADIRGLRFFCIGL